MEKKKNWFSRLREGLGKTSGWFAGLFGEDRINEDFYDELEEAMILADMGMETAEKLLSKLKDTVRTAKMTTRQEANVLTGRSSKARSASAGWTPRSPTRSRSLNPPRTR